MEGKKIRVMLIVFCGLKESYMQIITEFNSSRQTHDYL